ncbi:MAG: hypothetical protein ACRD0K_14420, partial [Egibacteraceae bacterium]
MRYVLLGLARARSEWFRSVASWANTAAIPAEFYKCVSAEELRARLTSGRAFSAALLDGGLPSTDRDLIAAVRDASCIPLIVDDGHGRDWQGLGAAAILPPTMTQEQLLDALAAHATMVSSGAALPTLDIEPEEVVRPPAPLVAVCGIGGAGASCVAMALAQGLAEPALTRKDGTYRPVLLADFCRAADQAMLHDARDVVPGVQELVELHRGRRPMAFEVHAQTFHVEERGYQLLLGLRRPRYWSTLRPRSFEAALSSLRHAFGAVVCDVEPDLEGESDTGSLDVEERNLMARTVIGQADGVFVVSRPDLPGLHGVVRLIAGLVEFGVPARRIVPVLNQTPRRSRQRAELTRAVHDLVGGVVRDGEHLPPLFLPARRVEDALRDGVALPAPLPAILVGAFRGLLTDARTQVAPSLATPVPVAPG